VLSRPRPTTGWEFTGSSKQQQIDTLDETVAALRYATDLARQLRGSDPKIQ
jgi:hypothetical protein